MTSNADMSNDTGTSSVSWREVLTRQHGPALILVCMGVWLHAAESLLVATMMPAIVADIGGAEQVAWTIALYEIGTIVAGAAGGLLALRHGIRLPMGTAALAYAAGSAIAALAPSMEVLLLGRVLQGLGGGGLMALSFIAVGVLFPKRLTARVMAAITTLWGVSSLFGPLIGGLFVELSSWRNGFWFFTLQALVLALWIGVGVRLKERPVDERGGQRLPIRRLLFLASGIMLIAYAGIDIQVIRTSALIFAGLVCLCIFLWLDGRGEDNRLLPRRPFSLTAPASAALTMILCFAAATVAIVAYGPLLMTSLHGISALSAGYIIAAASVSWTLAAVIVSGAGEQHDSKCIATGMLLISASIVGFCYAIPYGPVWLIVVFAIVQGVGFGLAWTFTLRQATSLVAADDKARIAGALPTAQRLGYALGAAVIGVVANAAGFADAVDRADTERAGMIIFASCLPIAALGLFAMFRFVSAKRPDAPAAMLTGT